MIRRMVPLLLLLQMIILGLYTRQAECACAEVKIEIVQEATFERIAFDARLSVTNNNQNIALTNVRVDVHITDQDGGPADNSFFVKVSDLQNIGEVDGTGQIDMNQTGEVHWLIIPSPGAGGTDPFGKVYNVGATLTYMEGTNQKLVPILPDQITVMPQPELTLDYFMPIDVVGDDPYTSNVESPVPYSLGLRVKNTGYGDAWNFKIQSAQPEITANESGALMDFEIISSEVNDQPSDLTLLVDFGDLNAGESATARWTMQSTLSGKFTSLNVEFEHASDLGGRLTSLIQAVNVHYLIHEVKVGLTGSDNLLDFLGGSTTNSVGLPDKIYDSQGGNYPVNVILNTDVTITGYPAGANPTVDLTLNNPPSPSWIYVKLTDPAQGLIPLSGAVRGDGVPIDVHNVWITQVKKSGESGYDYYLNLLDYREVGTNASYTIQYQPVGSDVTPPVTSVNFGTPNYPTPAKTYVAPTSQVVFSAVDETGGSGVDFMEYNIDSTGWQPAYPYDFDAPDEEGDHQIEYRSRDRAGNLEATQAIDVFSDWTAPVVGTLTANPPVFFPGAPANLGAVKTSMISTTVSDDVPDLDITLKVAQGQGVFNTLPLIRTIQGTASSGSSAVIQWDGKNESGTLMSPGIYSLQMTVDDHLGHSTQVTGEVTISDYNTVQALDPNLSGNQQYPDIYGDHVVWQDKRSGDWDIYDHDTVTGQTVPLVTGAGNQERPAIYGTEVVWQDDRNGDYDIYRKTLDGTETLVYSGPGDQAHPAISNSWIVWQDKRSGFWDIYAYRLSDGHIVQITSDVRDQMNPRISGDLVVWEDYRHGLGEIYLYDLATSTETRITNNAYQQMAPAILNGALLWTDQRNGSRDIHFEASAGGQDLRLNYELSDQDQATFNGVDPSVVFYTDYTAGFADPNIALLSETSGIGYFVSTDHARQEEPAAYNQRVVWQDNRDGIWQVYSAVIQLPSDQVGYEVVQGFNNMVVTGYLTATVATDAFGLLSAWESTFGVTSLKQFDPPTRTYRVADYDLTTQTATGDNFTLEPGKGLIMIIKTPGTFNLGQRTVSSCTPLTLEQGFNNIGTLCLPSGYSAYDFINSVGKNISGQYKVISVQQLDKDTGLWRGAAVRNGQVIGDDFVIAPGEGLMVEMAERVFGWVP